MPYVIATVSQQQNNDVVQPVGVRYTPDATWEFIKWYLGTLSGKRAKEVLTKIVVRIYVFTDEAQLSPDQFSADYDLQTLTAGELLQALASGKNPVKQRGEPKDEGS